MLKGFVKKSSSRLVVRFPPTWAAFRSSPLQDKPSAPTRLLWHGIWEVCRWLCALNQGQMIAAPGLGEKETERNYGLKGLEGRAKNKIPAMPDPKLLLLSLQRGWVFLLFYWGESAFCVTRKSRTLIERLVTLLSKSRVVPVVVLSSWDSSSSKTWKKLNHLLFSRWPFLSHSFQWRITAQMVTWLKEMPKDNMIKRHGAFLLVQTMIGTYEKRNNHPCLSFLHCWPSPPAFSFTSTSYFLCYPDRDDTQDTGVEKRVWEQ